MLIDPTVLACKAGVSVWFRSKERPRGKTGERDFGSARTRIETRDKKSSPHSFTWPFFTPSLTLVLHSLHIARKRLLRRLQLCRLLKIKY